MNMDGLLERYTLENRSVIFRFLDKLAKKTRKSGEIEESKKIKIIASFEEFDTDVVIASMIVYLDMYIPAAKGGRGKNEKYARGIMENKQAEKNAKVGDGVGRDKGRSDAGGGKRAAGMEGDEGSRLQQLAGSAGGGRLECDF